MNLWRIYGEWIMLLLIEGFTMDLLLRSKGEQIHQVSKLNFTHLVTVDIIYLGFWCARILSLGLN